MSNNKEFLLTGEDFAPKRIDKISDSQLSDSEINEKYRKGEMRIVTEQGRIDLQSIGTILDSKQGDKKKYNLNPEYQRRKRWSNRRKSLLIESFIMNVPIPPIFLYEVEYAVYEVMDGLQRLSAIYDFYKGNFALEGLVYWEELNGRRYSELPDNVRAGIDRRYLSSIILLEETAKSKEEAEFLKQIVFERLNSGGEKLVPQETRNALYGGNFNRLCIKLSKNIFFRKMWQLPLFSEGEDKLLENENYRNMTDVENVLRFFAYRHIEALTNVDKFLDNYLKHANNYSEDLIGNLDDIFNQTVELVFSVLGESAFYLPPSDREQKTPRLVVYDGVMQAFSRKLEHRDKILVHKEEIKNNLYKDQTLLVRADRTKNANLFDGRYNNRTDVQARIDYFEKYLNSFIF